MVPNWGGPYNKYYNIWGLYCDTYSVNLVGETTKCVQTWKITKGTYMSEKSPLGSLRLSDFLANASLGNPQSLPNGETTKSVVYMRCSVSFADMEILLVHIVVSHVLQETERHEV